MMNDFFPMFSAPVTKAFSRFRMFRRAFTLGIDGNVTLDPRDLLPRVVE
jgi:hypothetical protein